MDSSSSSSEREGLCSDDQKTPLHTRSPNAPPKILVLPAWTQDMQSLQIETRNILRKFGTTSKVKTLRRNQKQNFPKVAREKKERPVNSVSTTNLSILRHGTSEEYIAIEGSANEKKILDNGSNLVLLNSVFDDNGPTRPRQHCTDPHVYTQTRKILCSIEPNDRENERRGLQQMDILRDLTSEEKSEEVIERLRRRPLIRREEEAARKIQQNIRFRLRLENTAVLPATHSMGIKNDEELYLSNTIRINRSAGSESSLPRSRALFKNLSLKPAANIQLNDCLPSLDAAGLSKEATKDVSDDRSCKNAARGKLFLEDGTPSDYLGSRILKICKRTRPKSAPNATDASEEDDELLIKRPVREDNTTWETRFEKASDRIRLPVVYDNGNRMVSIVKFGNKMGPSSRLPSAMTLMRAHSRKGASNPVSRRGFELCLDEQGIETKTQRCVSSSQSYRINEQGRDPALRAEEHYLAQRLESDGIVLSKNGEPGPLCRRYRSEVFQEEFILKHNTSTIYETERKRFKSVLQQSHPIYRMLMVATNECNLRHRAWRRVKYWFRSLMELLRLGKVERQRTANAINFPSSKVTICNQRKLLVLAKNSCQMMYHSVISSGATEIDVAEFKAKPIALYQPRIYMPTEVKLIVLTDVREVNADLTLQQTSFEGKTSLEIKEWKNEAIFEADRSSQYGPCIANYAAIRQRPVPSNMAIGGLSTEIIFSHFVTSEIALYGDFTCNEHSLLLPEPSSTSVAMESSHDVVSNVVSRACVERGFDSPIDRCLPSPIIIYSGINPDEQYYRMKNRQQLSNTKEFFGFRISESAPSPVLNSEIKTYPVLPSRCILSPNIPKVEQPRTTHSDLSYPFCQPTGRVLTTKDYQHVLHRGEPSPNKTRTFTSFCSRQPGKFMSKCDTTAPLGRTVSKTYCNWNLIKSQPVQEFQDGVEVVCFFNDEIDRARCARPDSTEIVGKTEKVITDLPFSLDIYANLKHPGTNSSASTFVNECIHEGSAVDANVNDRKRVKDPTSAKALVEVLINSSEEGSPSAALLQTDALVDSITKALSGVLKDVTNTSDLIRVGVGLGMSLGAQGLLDRGNQSRSTQILNAHETSEGSNVCPNSGRIFAASEPAHDSGIKAALSSETNKILSLIGVEVSNELYTSRDSLSPNRQTNEGIFFSSSVIRYFASSPNKLNGISLADTLLTAASSTRVAKKASCIQIDFPDFPNCKPIGRVKPVPVEDDWTLAGYNPWCSQDLLSGVEFESSFPDQEVAVPDAAASEIKMAREFAEVISFVKERRYDEIEEKLSSHDWFLPVDYENSYGNTIFMICCQHGSRRLVKLFLKKGSCLNKQNISGQTCLHYAFGYGFDDLGRYLINKGADDKILNADGLTCYEGFHMDEVDAL